jgi:hypothetical protein
MSASYSMTQEIQNPRRDARFYQHKSHFLEFVDPAIGRGLEIGAFDLPLVDPSEGECDFADWNTTEHLKEIARHAVGHHSEFVVPVQFNLLQGYDQVPEGYNWIAASHVIEHVPDLIGWLAKLHSKLKPGGVLFLVIPDKRYIFDMYRRESTLTEALAAYRSGLKHPSFAQVFDYFYYCAPGVIGHDVWAGKPVPSPNLDFAGSLALAERAESSYQDAHCWVLTPDSFHAILRTLIDAKISHLQLEGLRQTAPGGIDFSVVLRRGDERGAME